MKLLSVVIGLSMLVATSAFSHEGERDLVIETYDCTDSNFSRAWVTVTAGTFVPGSGLKSAIKGGVLFNYSAADNMVCEGLVKDGVVNIDCAGYYQRFSTTRELTELKLRGSGDSVVATWVTSVDYGSKKMESKCVLK